LLLLEAGLSSLEKWQQGHDYLLDLCHQSFQKDGNSSHME
jgi:hypothetical protein